MQRIMLVTSLLFLLSGGAAMADRFHGGGGGHREGGWNHSGWHGGGGWAPQRGADRDRGYRREYRGGGGVYVRGGYRGEYRGVRYERRPIYVRGPEIRYHYYNRWQRPELIVENYAAQPGYVWVRGHWDWNGYEWMWTPGHWQPDPAYANDYDYDYDGD